MATRIGVIGAAGYVGLPVALNFARKFDVIAFDIDHEKIGMLNDGIDPNREHDLSNMGKIESLKFTSLLSDLAGIDIYIICVPTPINEAKNPDLSYLKKACKYIGAHISFDALVIVESTVYPGTVEYELVPVIEQYSGLKYMSEFRMGYSPERINPGDDIHTIRTMPKLIAACNKEALGQMSFIYSQVIEGDIIPLHSIKAAESVKIFENAQRDLNIAFLNECSMIFKELGIDFSEVLRGVKTKWNSLSFTPGLVGGHCIGIDSYYLTHIAKLANIEPEVINAGRRVNEDLHIWIALNLFKALRYELQEKRVLMLGSTYKPNVSDPRNSGAIKLATFLMQMGVKVDIIDPVLDTRHKIKSPLVYVEKPEIYYSAAILAVPHNEFLNLEKDYFTSRGIYILFDLYGIYKYGEEFNTYWSL